MVAQTGLTVVQDKVDVTIGAINELADRRIMVGIPSTRAGREDAEGEEINNAALGYIHENGAPEANIPARPWLVPGVQRAEEATVAGLRRVAEAALDGRPEVAEQRMNAVGLRAVSSVKGYLTEGVGPPLASSTIRSRRYSRKTQSMRKGEVQELARRAAGEAPGVDLVKPLINTAQMLNAVTYVIRKVTGRA